MKLDFTYASKLDHIQDIEERNQAFDQLTEEEQRKEIAWDVIKLVEAKTITASHGCYWGGDLHEINTQVQNRIITTSKEVQKQVLKVQKCSVCARGAAMLSQIRLSNNVCDNDVSCGNDENVKGFTMSAMHDMENEFEHSSHYLPYDENSDEKLINIFLNVIHNGDFDTSDDTDYLAQFLIS